MNQLRKEFEVFLRCSHSMQVLMVSNMIYALVLPVIEVFVAAYVMRNSHAVSKVVTYQLSIYAATPLAFFLNGKLLGRVGAKHLYAAGMVLSGVAMMLMMQLSILTPIGVATSGFTMGLATGIFWANRGYLALTATNDGNRNYYYGLENFMASLAAVAVPALIGFFISGTSSLRLAGRGCQPRVPHHRVCGFWIDDSVCRGILERGTFRNPEHTRFVFFHFHPLWWRMLQLALLKGLAQGYIVTAPAMLIMLLVGQEGTLGTTQADRRRVLRVPHVYGRTNGRAQASHHRLFLPGSVSSCSARSQILCSSTPWACSSLSGASCWPSLCWTLPITRSSCRWSMWSLASKDAMSTPISSTTNLDCLRAAAWAAGYSWASRFGWSGHRRAQIRLPVIALLQLLSIRVAGQISRES